MTTPLDHARDLQRRGYAVVPVPFRQKKPRINKWPDLRLAEADLPKHFNSRPQNVGIILGSASGDRVDIDLDHPLAVKYADEYLPPTPAVFGRDGKPRSHRIYRPATPMETEKFPSKKKGMLLEIRSEGCQTVGPGSEHPSGEKVRWDEDGEPAVVDPALLRNACVALAERIKAELGEKPSGKGRARPCPPGATTPYGAAAVKKECDELGAAPVGTRNDALNKAAFALGQLVGGGEVDQAEAERALCDGARACGLPDDETDRTLRSGLEAGKTEPRRAPAGSSGPVRPDCPESPGPYRVTPSGIAWDKPTKDGPTPTLLTNFPARIVADVSRDDGAERRRVFEIEAEVGGATCLIQVPVERFGGMNWPTEHLGVNAIVYPGVGTRDHARAAIQMLSRDVQHRVIYEHFGWVRISDAWAFLHAGGAIGKDGPVEGIEVAPPADLSKYVLPAPAKDEALRKAVLASLDLRKLGPDRITVPLLCGIYRAVAGTSCNFSAWGSGSSGSLKSSTTAVFLCHFGPDFDDRSLPGNWSSTANALEGISFAAKDVPFVIDDFAPNGTAHDIARLHAAAERVLRAAGNQSGRQRSGPDGRQRATRPPRSLIISTGEDVPVGLSLRARTFIIEFSAGDIDLKKLSAAQGLAREGVYASAMSAFISWLAARLEDVRAEYKRKYAELRAMAQRSEAHRRTAGIVADLYWGCELFVRFAQEAGVLTAIEADQYSDDAWVALGETASAQVAHQRDADPVARFMSLLGTAVSSGAAHIASAASDIHEPSDELPPDPAACGWRPVQVGVRTEWRPQGMRVGWTDGESLYLDPDAAYAVANKAGGDWSLGIKPTALGKRLNDAGMLLTREGDHLKVKVMLHGARPRVWHLSLTHLLKPGQPGHPGHRSRPDAGNAACAPVLCPGLDAGEGATGAANRGSNSRDAAQGGSGQAAAPSAPEAPVSGADTGEQSEKEVPI